MILQDEVLLIAYSLDIINTDHIISCVDSHDVKMGLPNSFFTLSISFYANITFTTNVTAARTANVNPISLKVFQ